MTMEISDPRIRSLMRQAQRIAENGKRAAAEKLYRQILEEAPETTQAWVGLAEVLSDPDQQETAYKNALALDPANEEAQTGLAILLGDEPPAVEVVTRAEDEEDEEVEEEKAEVAADPFDQNRDWLRSVTELPPALEKSPAPAAAPKTVERSTPIPGPSTGEQADHQAHEVVQTGEEVVLFCANHPDRKTNLRCNRCGKPMCSTCARPTPVGYRCPECIREQEDAFFSATLIDYGLAVLVSLPLALIAGALAARIGFFVIFLAAFAGGFIGRVAFRAARRHRGRWLPHTVATVVAIGGVLPAFPYLIALMFGSLGSVLGLVWLAIYVVIATGAAFYQIK